MLHQPFNGPVVPVQCGGGLFSFAAASRGGSGRQRVARFRLNGLPLAVSPFFLGVHAGRPGRRTAAASVAMPAGMAFREAASPLFNRAIFLPPVPAEGKRAEQL